MCPRLAHLGHPGAKNREKVWAASHDRAVIEEGWRRVSLDAEGGLRHPPFDRYELQKLLAIPTSGSACSGGHGGCER